MNNTQSNTTSNQVQNPQLVNGVDQSKTPGGQDYQALLAEIAALKAKTAELEKAKEVALSIKMGDKGTVCIYGLGRFPTSAYPEQWVKIFALQPKIEAFIKANAEELKRRSDFAKTAEGKAELAKKAAEYEAKSKGTDGGTKIDMSTGKKES